MQQSVWLDVQWEEFVTASLRGFPLTYVHNTVYGLMPIGKTLGLRLPESLPLPQLLAVSVYQKSLLAIRYSISI